MLLKKILLYFCGILFLSSCTVTNNLYVNDPVPVQKIDNYIYLGIGTGVRAEIDSVSANGDISFSDDISMAPNLYFGGQIALIHNLNLRFSAHLPYIIGGFGGRVGPQFSFFRRESKFNMAIAFDLGFVVAKDSLKIFGSSSALDIYVNGAINADFFVPFSYSFNKKTRIIITPRYSFNTFYIRQNTKESKSHKFSPYVPSLAIGFRTDKMYFEASAFQFQNKYFPNFGFVYVF